MPAGESVPVTGVRFTVQCGHCGYTLNVVDVPAADEVLTEAKWRGVALACPSCHKTQGPKITKIRSYGGVLAPTATP